MQPAPARPVYRFGEFELDSARFELRRGDKVIRLEKLPMELLLLLLERRGALVSRREILERLWDPNVFVDTEQGINTAVRKIRAALLPGGEGAVDPLQTVVGKGYRIAMPVEVLSPSDIRPSSGAVRRPPAIPRSWLIAALLGIAIAIAGLWLSRRTMRTDIRSVAVLPFDNFTGDSGQDYFVDGMTDAVLTRVAQAGSFRVISRTSVMKYRGTRRNVRDIARELNVDAVLEGSVSREPSRLRVTAQLIDARADRHLWADQFDRDSSEVLQLQDDIARHIAQSVAGSLRTSASPVPRGRVDPHGYDDYLRARALALQRTPPSLAQAIEFYQRSLQVEPQFADAFAGLADAYAAEGYNSFIAPQESFLKSKAAAQQALGFDPNSADAHAALGYSRFYYDWDVQAADQEFAAALRANPNHSVTHHWRSIELTALGRYPEAHQEIELAQALDPLSAVIDTDIGFELYYAGRYDEAIQHLTQVTTVSPKFPGAHLWLGRAYEEKGMFRESVAELERANALVPDWPVTLAALGHARARAGDLSAAKEILQRLLALSKTHYVTPYAIALVYESLDDKANAIVWLRTALNQRSHWLVWLRTDPRFKRLRSDPEFQKIISAVLPNNTV